MHRDNFVHLLRSDCQCLEAHRRVINVQRKSIYFTYTTNYAAHGLIALGKIQMYLNGIQIVALCLRHR